MGSNNTSIKYAGVVSIEFPNRRVVCNNNGSGVLFDVLSRFMAKQSVSVKELPGYIMIYKANKNEILSRPNTSDSIYPSVELLVRMIPVTAGVERNGRGESTILYTVSLKNDDFKFGTSVTSTDSVCLALISSDTNTILAVTELTDSVSTIQAIQQGMHANVRWQLSFENSN